MGYQTDPKEMPKVIYAWPFEHWDYVGGHWGASTQGPPATMPGTRKYVLVEDKDDVSTR